VPGDQTFHRMADDMDINAGRVLEGLATLDELGHEIYDSLLATAQGNQTASEALGHQEFVLTYLHEAPPTDACAAFIKESRMEFANARRLNRKSGCTLG
jgi:hypothetical protein